MKLLTNLFFIFLTLLLFNLVASESYSNDGFPFTNLHLPTTDTNLEELGLGSKKNQDFSVNNSGQFNYSYNFELPQGRNGFKPDLSLIYNSDNQTSSTYVGYGWELTVPYIARSTKYGAPKYDESDTFEFNMNNANGDLLYVGDNYYRAEIELGFYRFEKISNFWEVTSKNGTKFIFGNTNGSIINSKHPSDAFKWYLTKVIDTNGNVIEYIYNYDLDRNHPYLIEIKYGENLNHPLGYHPYSISFEYIDEFIKYDFKYFESISYISGNKVISGGRLVSHINIGYNEDPFSAPETIRSYKLDYSSVSNQKPNNLLNKIRYFNDNNQEDVSKRIDFDYYKNSMNLSQDDVIYPFFDEYENMIYDYRYGEEKRDSTKLHEKRFMDMENWTILEGQIPRSARETPEEEAIARATTFIDYKFEYPVLSYSKERFDRLVITVEKLMDINGDGFLDYVVSNCDPEIQRTGSDILFNGVENYWDVFINDGNRHFIYKKWQTPLLEPEFEDIYIFAQLPISCISTSLVKEDDYNPVIKDTIDMTGDSKPDIFYSGKDNFYICKNNGQGFDNCEMWEIHPDIEDNYYKLVKDSKWLENGTSNRIFKAVSQKIIDMNGDGLPDFVKGMPYKDTYLVCYNGYLKGFTGFIECNEWNIPTIRNIWDSTSPDYPALQLCQNYAIGSAEEGQVREAIFCVLDLLDFNKDGLTDYLVIDDNFEDYSRLYVFYNNGKGFEMDENEIADIKFLNLSSIAYRGGLPNYYLLNNIALFDQNGDGFIDINYFDRNDNFSTISVKNEGGLGFDFRDYSYFNRYHYFFNQTLQDKIEEEFEYLTELINYNSKVNISYASAYYDINNDGLLDVVSNIDSNIFFYPVEQPMPVAFQVKESKLNTQLRLRKIVTGSGKVVKINYKNGSSADEIKYKNLNKAFSKIIVDEVDISPGIGKDLTVKYEFKNAYYDSLKKNFLGYAESSQKQISKDTGKTLKTIINKYFENGIEPDRFYLYKGIPYYSSIRSGYHEGFKFTDINIDYPQTTTIETINKIDVKIVADYDGEKVYFPYVSNSKHVVLDDMGWSSETEYVKHIENFEYDEYGNLEKYAKTNNDGSDKIVKNVFYDNINKNDWIASYPSKIVQDYYQDNFDKRTSITEFFYDSSNSTSAQVLIGNLTKTRQLLTEDADSQIEHYAVKEFNYYPNGNLKTETSYPSGKSYDNINEIHYGCSVTYEYNYDIDSKVYNSITNYTYDSETQIYPLEKIIRVKDTNNNVRTLFYRSQYDPKFSRLVEENSNNVIKSYEYDEFNRLFKTYLHYGTQKVLFQELEYELSNLYLSINDISADIFDPNKIKIITYPSTNNCEQVNDETSSENPILINNIIDYLQPYNLDSLASFNDNISIFNIPEVRTNNVTACNTEDARVQSIYLDGFGRVLQEQKFNGVKWIAQTSNIYNELGLITNQYLPFYTDRFDKFQDDYFEENFIEYVYDGLGRIKQKIFTDQSSIKYSYLGEIISTLDEIKNRKRYILDYLGRVTKIIEFNGDEKYTTYYSYNENNELTKIIDSKSNHKDYIYDSLGRLIKVSDYYQYGNRRYYWRFYYDDAGNLIRKLSPENNEIRYNYDESNRIVFSLSQNKDGVVDEAQSYHYDDTPRNAFGKLFKVTGGIQDNVYSYDKQGRIISEGIIYNEQTLNDNVSSFSYLNIPQTEFNIEYYKNNLGEVTSIKYPEYYRYNKYTVNYEYNRLGLTKKVYIADDYNSIRDIINFADYNEQNQLTKVEFGNNYSSEFIYYPDDRYRLGKIITKDNCSNRIEQNNRYVYYKNSNVSAIVKEIGNNTIIKAYIYDELNRLNEFFIQKINGDIELIEYQYDSIGNIIYNTNVGTYKYNYNINTDNVTITPYTLNEIELQNNAKRSYYYNLDGNLVREQRNNPNIAYRYNFDSKGRLNKANFHLNSEYYFYDFNDKRTIKIKDNYSFDIKGIFYISDFLETNSGGNAYYNIYFNNELIAQEKIYNKSNPQNGEGVINEIKFYHKDHLNNTDFVSLGHKEEGTNNRFQCGSTEVLKRSGYLPFGDDADPDSLIDYDPDLIDDYTYKYNGKEDDGILYYYGARYYDPQIGRFISQDPLFKNSPSLFISDPQRLNHYSYAKNNPVTNVDVNGNADLSMHKLGNIKYLKSVLANFNKMPTPIKEVFATANPYADSAIDINNLRIGIEKGDLWLAGASGVSLALGSFLNSSWFKMNSEIKNISNGAKRIGKTAKYIGNWAQASLSNVIEKFAHGAKGFDSGTGKIIYKKNDSSIQVVLDEANNYFRIEDTSLTGRRKYLDLDGKIPNNKTVDGKTTGRTQSEYNEVTHFENID